MFTIERRTGALGRERLHIKGFRECSAMHDFLNKGGNGVVWHESQKGLKPGVYAYAGGRWHNTKSLDALTLAHC